MCRSPRRRQRRGQAPGVTATSCPTSTAHSGYPSSTQKKWTLARFQRLYDQSKFPNTSSNLVVLSSEFRCEHVGSKLQDHHISLIVSLPASHPGKRQHIPAKSRLTRLPSSAPRPTRPRNDNFAAHSVAKHQNYTAAVAANLSVQSRLRQVQEGHPVHQPRGQVRKRSDTELSLHLRGNALTGLPSATRPAPGQHYCTAARHHFPCALHTHHQRPGATGTIRSQQQAVERHVFITGINNC